MKMKHITKGNRMRKAATALIMTAISAATYAGNPVTVKGVITDSSGEPLVGATIAVPGTTTGYTGYIGRISDG